MAADLSRTTKTGLTAPLKRAMLLALSVAMGASLAACNGKQVDSGPAKTVTIATIAYPFKGQQVFNGLTGIVIEQGWLKDKLAKKGVSLAFAPVPTAVGGPQINEGFSAKRIDFAAYGDFPVTIAVAGGVPLKLVAPVGQGSEVYLVVRKGLTARSLADLKGKKIALHRGRPWELPFSKLADTSHLKLTDFTIVNINPSATPAALESGSVDAAVLMSDALLVEKRGIGHVIWSTKTAPADWKMRAELFARKDFVDDNPELTQTVVNAYVKAAAWASDEANRATMIEHSSRGTLPVDVVEKDYDNPAISWKERYSPIFSPAVRTHYHSVADYAFERKLVRSKIDADALIDDRFVKQALKDLNLEGFWANKSASALTATPTKAGGKS